MSSGAWWQACWPGWPSSTGVLGGFTTFSAFGLETMFLLKRGDVLIAAANVVLSVAAGLVALWLGMTLVSAE
jgi:CrcB protein